MFRDCLAIALNWPNAGLRVNCPGCGEGLTMAALQRMAPAAVDAFLDALADMWLRAHGAIRCACRQTSGGSRQLH